MNIMDFHTGKSFTSSSISSANERSAATPVSSALLRAFMADTINTVMNPINRARYIIPASLSISQFIP